MYLVVWHTQTEHTLMGNRFFFGSEVEEDWLPVSSYWTHTQPCACCRAGRGHWLLYGIIREKTMDSCNSHCHWVLVHFMLLLHNVQLYYQSVTLAQDPAKLYYIVENHKPSMHLEECTIMSVTLDCSESTVIKKCLVVCSNLKSIFKLLPIFATACISHCEAQTNHQQTFDT